MSTCSHRRRNTYTSEANAQKAAEALKRQAILPLSTTVKQCGGCGRWRVWVPAR